MISKLQILFNCRRCKHSGFVKDQNEKGYPVKTHKKPEYTIIY